MPSMRSHPEETSCPLLPESMLILVVPSIPISLVNSNSPLTSGKVPLPKYLTLTPTLQTQSRVC